MPKLTPVKGMVREYSITTPIDSPDGANGPKAPGEPEAAIGGTGSAHLPDPEKFGVYQ